MKTTIMTVQRHETHSPAGAANHKTGEVINEHEATSIDDRCSNLREENKTDNEPFRLTTALPP